MSRKEDKARNKPEIDAQAAEAAARFRAMANEGSKYLYLSSFNFPLDNAIRKQLGNYWPWTGPLRAHPDVTVTLNYAEWLQAAQIGSI